MKSEPFNMQIFAVFRMTNLRKKKKLKILTPFNSYIQGFFFCNSKHAQCKSLYVQLEEKKTHLRVVK